MLILATTSKITAAAIEVGHNTGNTGTATLRLGTGTNTIHANVISVGGGANSIQDNRGRGLIDFYDGSLGNVTIRAADGAGRATINVVNNSSSTGVGNTGAVLLTGHYADVLTGTMTIASRGATASTSTSSGTFAFGTGVFDATTITLSSRIGVNFTSGGTVGELTLGGGTVTVGTLTMAQNTGGTSFSTNTGDAIADVTISGGTVSIGTVTMGTNTVNGAANGSNSNATISITGGTTTVSTDFIMGVQRSATNASTTVNSAISTVNISGGALTLSGNTNLVMATTQNDPNNDASGAITITGGGSLTVGGNIEYTNGLGTETNTVTLDGGLLDMTSGTIGAAAALITFNAQSGTLQNLHQFNGGQPLLKTGSSSTVLSLSGSNAWTGGTTITSGTLDLASADALPTSGTVTMNGGALRWNSNGTASAIDPTAGSRAILLVDGSSAVFDTTSNAVTFANPLQTGPLGTSSVTKTGAGTLTIAGVNTYTGTTTVLDGTLAVNGSLSGSLLDVKAGATLMGSGTIVGLTTIAGIHSPGNSPAVQTFNDLSYAAGSAVNWELWGNTSSNDPLAFDQIVVNGDLTFSGSTTLTLAFTGSASPTNYSTVVWSDTFWNTNQEWLLYQVTGTTSGYGNLALNTTNWLDSTNAAFQTARQGSTFALENRVLATST